jgi:F-type H+-transporting ATPase subunit delta
MPGTARYAKALLGLAKEQQQEEQVGIELSQVVTVLADPALAKVLALPNLLLKTRKDIVEQVVQALKPQAVLGSFLRVLVENDRLNAIEDIEQAYQRLLEHTLGRVRAKIRSAAQLSDREVQELVTAFSQLTQMTVVPTVEVDPELLGGVVVEIEGRVYDASLRTQLRRLGETLAQQL